MAGTQVRHRRGISQSQRALAAWDPASFNHKAPRPVIARRILVVLLLACASCQANRVPQWKRAADSARCERILTLIQHTP